MAKSLKSVNCGIAQTLDIVGEWWTLMILRNAFLGMRTFDAMQDNLGMSTSVLSARLRKLTGAGLLERRQSASDGRSFEYVLTDKGLDLYPVVVGLMQWGEKHAPEPRGPRMTLVERGSGAPVRGAQVVSEDGRRLGPRDVLIKPGPGMDPAIRSHLEQRKRNGA